MFSPAFIVTVLAAVACAKPVARSLQVKDSRPHAPTGFALKGAAPNSTVLELKIALAQNDAAGLEKALLDAATPGSAKYGQWLSKEEVESYVSPTSETASAVKEWLLSNNINVTTASAAGDWLKISIPVSQANELLDAQFSEFTHVDTGVTSIRTLSYSVPSDLTDYLQLVHPTTSFDIPSSTPKIIAPAKLTNVNATSGAAPASCGTEITPTCLQELYGIPSTPATQSSNVLGVTGFLDQYPQISDLELFLQDFRPDITSGISIVIGELDGGTDPQGSSYAGVEANLDLQYTVGVATNVPVEFFSVGEDSQTSGGGFEDIIVALLDQSTVPTVLTTSYGQGEVGLSSDYANTLCNLYMQLGARGVSITFSSGDSGVGSDCTTFAPDFPASCPYVTAVGATMSVPETSASFSGGGFSTIFSRPSWQDTAVTNYLNSIGSEYSGLYNAAGRGYPDVSAMGDFVVIANAGSLGLVAGTSCSSPIFASVIALINDKLIAAGKPVLGFLNPWLYSTAANAFNDITTGNNPGCNTNGFSATSGWDPVTGLGTPNYASLLAAAGV